MKRDLPNRMYLEGRSYRYHPPGGGKKVSLGRNYDTAINQYYLITKTDPDAPVVGPEAIQELWKRHQKGAKQRKIDFTITADDVSSLMERQANRCAVTRLSFKYDKPGNMRIRPWIPSIDRINTKLGYTPTNIRIVCAFVNVAMNGFGEDFFSVVLGPLIESEVQARLAGMKS